MSQNVIEFPPVEGRPSQLVAAEIRAVMARKGVRQTTLAQALGRPQAWVSRRLGRNADVDLTFEEVFQMAKALGVSAEGLVLYAIRDSNPEPADMEHGVVVDLVAYRAGRVAA